MAEFISPSSRPKEAGILQAKMTDVFGYVEPEKRYDLKFLQDGEEKFKSYQKIWALGNWVLGKSMS